MMLIDVIYTHSQQAVFSQVEALEQFSEPTRVTRFKTCLCFFDGTTEFYEYGMCDCDMIFCNTLRTVSESC